MPISLPLDDLELSLVRRLTPDQYEKMRAELRLLKVFSEHLSQDEAQRLIIYWQNNLDTPTTAP